MKKYVLTSSLLSPSCRYAYIQLVTYLRTIMNIDIERIFLNEYIFISAYQTDRNPNSVTAKNNQTVWRFGMGWIVKKCCKIILCRETLLPWVCPVNNYLSQVYSSLDHHPTHPQSSVVISMLLTPACLCQAVAPPPASITPSSCRPVNRCRPVTACS